jgi:hypothetical protein
VTNEEKASNLLRRYFLKLEKDILHDIDLKIKEALKDEDYPKVIKLQGEKDGAFSVIVALLRGCLFYGQPNPEEAVKRYLKANIYRKK